MSHIVNSLRSISVANSSRSISDAAARAFVIATLLAWTVVNFPAIAATEIGAAKKVVKDVFGLSLNKRMAPGEVLVLNQKVRTGTKSVATLGFLDDSTLVVGPRAEVTLDKFMFDPDANVIRGSFKAARGLMRFASGSAKVDFSIKTRVATMGIRGTAFDFLVKQNATEIIVREGSVEVTSRGSTDTVDEGQILSVSSSNGAVRTSEISEEMKLALKQTFKLLGTTSQQHLAEWRSEQRQESAQTTPEVRKSILTASLTQAPSTNEKENLLYLDLEKGRVVIELKPSVAPRHAKRIRELVRQGFYNGLTFHNVVPKQVAVMGDPTGTGRGGTGQTLVNEVSSDPFIRGSVGMMPTLRDSGKTDSQIFICTDRLSHLDENYTLVGQVVTGMELIDSLNAGQPPKVPNRIKRVRVATDVKED